MTESQLGWFRDLPPSRGEGAIPIMRRNHVTKSQLGWFRGLAEQRRGGSTYYYEEDLL